MRSWSAAVALALVAVGFFLLRTFHHVDGDFSLRTSRSRLVEGER